MDLIGSWQFPPPPEVIDPTNVKTTSLADDIEIYNQ